jgi:hypothetical protein
VSGVAVGCVEEAASVKPVGGVMPKSLAVTLLLTESVTTIRSPTTKFDGFGTVIVVLLTFVALLLVAFPAPVKNATWAWTFVNPNVSIMTKSIMSGLKVDITRSIEGFI